MKKLLALCLCLAMLLSLAACSSDLAVTETAAETVTEAVTAKTGEEEETGEIVYPKGFSAGFGRGDITPEPPMSIGPDTTATVVVDPLYASVVAICDGENVALLVHLDIKNVPMAFFNTVTKRIQKNYGIPSDNVILNATHSHNSPTSVTGSTAELTRWHQKMYPAIDKAVGKALRDLAPAEIYTSKGDTEGFAFVRRYLLENGKYKMNPSAADKPIAHESEVDNELRAIRFERGDKKDILMVNWQCHAAHGRGDHPTWISSDFICNLRNGVEKEMDVHFSYHNGASGNLNFTNKVGVQKYANYEEAGAALVDVVKETVKTEKKAESGPIRTARGTITLNVVQDSDERKEGAKAFAKASKEDRPAILAQYGLASSYEVTAINVRAGYGATKDIEMFAIACGDIAFASVPFEQFDSDGKTIRESSPYDMTFICAYSNGHYGYLPSTLAYPNGSYEVYTTYFVQGTSDQVVAESVRLLQETAK